VSLKVTADDSFVPITSLTGLTEVLLMSQTVNSSKQVIPGLPRKPLTPEQQLEALSRVQSQAEARVELGLKLFKAAENHTRSQQKMLEQIKAEQQQLRDQVNEDVAKSLHAYDQWVGQMDENFTRSLQNLEAKIERLQENWMATQHRIEAMIERSAQMFAITHGMDNPQPQQAPVQPQAQQQAPITVEETPHAISIAPVEDDTDAQANALDQDATLEDQTDEPQIMKQQPKVQPRLKPESGTMYADLLKQLRQQADERKPEES
jgi:flagellar biosynthesis chaperone FliJ